MKNFWELVKKNEVSAVVYLQDIGHNTQTPEKTMKRNKKSKF